MDWTIYSWYCSNCKNKVAGLMNKNNQIKVKCDMCGAVMIRTKVSRRHDVIEIFAPQDIEEDIDIERAVE